VVKILATNASLVSICHTAAATVTPVSPDADDDISLAPPFSGHLHPVLALGRALAPQYEMRIISIQGTLSRITDAGLQCVGIFWSIWPSIKMRSLMPSGNWLATEYSSTGLSGRF